MTTITEITGISDIQQLAVAGFTDWKKYGEITTDTDGNLITFNYTAKAQYEGRWNFFERVSRGLIVNRKTGEVVARAFDKFFNWMERGEKASGHIVSVTEKLDGSLGILYRLDGGYRIATRGAFHSDQAEWATQFLSSHHDLAGLADELTLLFEIVYPENRVVVDYRGREALVLLAARNRYTGAYLPFFPDVYELGTKYGLPLPKVHSFNNITEIIERTGSLDISEEGYVVEFSDGTRWKFKGDKYLELHRLIFGLSFKKTLAAVASGSVDYIRSQIPDEFLGEFTGWVEQIGSVVEEIKGRVQRAFNAAPRSSRKDFALWVQANHKDLASYLFAMFDDKPIEPMIYRMAFENLRDEHLVSHPESVA